jgi:RND family efflux transporter MFP subunit
MKNGTRAVVVGLPILAVIVLGGAIVLSRPESTGDGGATAAAPVAIVSARDFTPRVVATGSIRLLPGARIDVGARVSGVVVSLPVTQGSRVTRGEVIARLDDREARTRLSLAESAVSELDALVRQQRVDLAREEALAKARVSTDQELLAARTALSGSESRLAGAVANLNLARLQLEYTIIRAPISGIVGSVTTHEGETIAASLASPTFVTLLDPTKIECVALVDESDVGRVTTGSSAEFTVDAYPGRTFHGVVAGIAPDATVISGVVDYETRVRITDPSADLKPQMTASIAISGEARTAMVVPTAAIRQSPTGTFVWRRRGGKLERASVVMGARQSDVSEIRSGLAVGDTVLTGAFPES